MRKLFVKDSNRSFLSAAETDKYKVEITRQKNSPVCRRMSTMEVADIGAKAMKVDKFRLVKGQFDV